MSNSNDYFYDVNMGDTNEAYFPIMLLFHPQYKNDNCHEIFNLNNQIINDFLTATIPNCDVNTDLLSTDNIKNIINNSHINSETDAEIVLKTHQMFLEIFLHINKIHVCSQIATATMMIACLKSICIIKQIPFPLTDNEYQFGLMFFCAPLKIQRKTLSMPNEYYINKQNDYEPLSHLMSVEYKMYNVWKDHFSAFIDIDNINSDYIKSFMQNNQSKIVELWRDVVVKIDSFYKEHLGFYDFYSNYLEPFPTNENTSFAIQLNAKTSHNDNKLKKHDKNIIWIQDDDEHAFNDVKNISIDDIQSQIPNGRERIIIEALKSWSDKVEFYKARRFDLYTQSEIINNEKKYCIKSNEINNHDLALTIPNKFYIGTSTSDSQNNEINNRFVQESLFDKSRNGFWHLQDIMNSQIATMFSLNTKAPMICNFNTSITKLVDDLETNIKESLKENKTKWQVSVRYNDSVFGYHPGFTFKPSINLNGFSSKLNDKKPELLTNNAAFLSFDIFNHLTGHSSSIYTTSDINQKINDFVKENFKRGIYTTHFAPLFMVLAYIAENNPILGFNFTTITMLIEKISSHYTQKQLALLMCQYIYQKQNKSIFDKLEIKNTHFDESSQDDLKKCFLFFDEIITEMQKTIIFSSKPIFIKTSEKNWLEPFVLKANHQSKTSNEHLNLDSKLGSARNFSANTILSKIISHVLNGDIPDNNQMQISEIMPHLSHESRYIVHNGQIVSSSPCWRKSGFFDIYLWGRIHPYFVDNHNSSKAFQDRKIAAQQAWFVRKLAKEHDFIVKNIYEGMDYSQRTFCIDVGMFFNTKNNQFEPVIIEIHNFTDNNSTDLPTASIYANNWARLLFKKKTTHFQYNDRFNQRKFYEFLLKSIKNLNPVQLHNFNDTLELSSSSIVNLNKNQCQYKYFHFKKHAKKKINPNFSYDVINQLNRKKRTENNNHINTFVELIMFLKGMKQDTSLSIETDIRKSHLLGLSLANNSLKKQNIKQIHLPKENQSYYNDVTFKTSHLYYRLSIILQKSLNISSDEAYELINHYTNMTLDFWETNINNAVLVLPSKEKLELNPMMIQNHTVHISLNNNFTETPFNFINYYWSKFPIKLDVNKEIIEHSINLYADICHELNYAHRVNGIPFNTLPLINNSFINYIRDEINYLNFHEFSFIVENTPTLLGSCYEIFSENRDETTQIKYLSLYLAESTTLLYNALAFLLGALIKRMRIKTGIEDLFID